MSEEEAVASAPATEPEPSAAEDQAITESTDSSAVQPEETPNAVEDSSPNTHTDTTVDPAGAEKAPAPEPNGEASAAVSSNTQSKPEYVKRPILDDGANKIFVGGISQESSDDDLKAYFGQYGEIVDITIMKDRMTGKSRGFGFITFENSEVADKMVASKHEINGKMVEAKPAVPRGSQGQMGQRPAPASDISQRATKIFVGGLSPSVNDAELKEYFAQFGTILEASVVVDKDTSRKRGFGFVTFSSYQTVDNILTKKEHNIMDKVVEVKKAFPKGTGSVPPMNRGPPPMAGRGGGYPPPRGYGGGGPGYYGGGQDGGYGQQQGGYSYYGGYDQSGGYQGGYGGGGYQNSGYQSSGYQSSGYPSGGYQGAGYQSGGAYQGYPGYSAAGYSATPAAPGYGTASASGYGEQQAAHASYGQNDSQAMYGAQTAQSAVSGYDAQQQTAYNGSYGAGYGGAAAAGYAAPAAATATPAAYGGYEDPSGGYNAASAAARYHPYSR